MFTGLVQAVGKVVGASASRAMVRLSIDPVGWKYNPDRGDSISVSGVCLTVANTPTRTRRRIDFDVVQETLNKTTLGTLTPGSRVNLEHAATPTTLLGGHLVQGHVDGVGRVAKVQRGKDWRVWIDLPASPRGRDRTPPLNRFIVPKGSVCVEGVSLTIAGVSRRGFHVALIPTTLEETTLGDLKPGDSVNIETDLIVKTVVSALERSGFARRSR